MESILSTKKIKLVTKKDKFTFIISPELLNKIKYICQKSPHNEWSGTLFYKINKESNNFSELVLEGKDLYLQDIGTSTYTEYEYTPDFANFVVTHPELMEDGICQGHIHSHQKMDTFFSGTDDAELLDSASTHNIFVSLIVNNAGTYSVALSTLVDEYIIGTQTQNRIGFNGTKIIINRDVNAKTTIAQKYDGTIVYPMTEVYPEIDELIESIKKTKETKETLFFNTGKSTKLHFSDRSLFDYPEKTTQPSFIDNTIPKKVTGFLQHTFTNNEIQTFVLLLLSNSLYYTGTIEQILDKLNKQNLIEFDIQLQDSLTLNLNKYIDHLHFKHPNMKIDLNFAEILIQETIEYLENSIYSLNDYIYVLITNLETYLTGDLL